ncbi:MAG: EamA family transporter [Nitrososphaerota archaeon]|nr:EamA family transporter [Candidatus Calditenuaceae archaeon]MDW8073768.1 EamA family transporter [Nitrososphaerota archaeon]
MITVMDTGFARLDIALALVAFVCLGLTDFIRRKGMIEGGSPLGYLLVEAFVLIAILPAATLLMDRRLPEIGGNLIPYALISGVTISIALIALMTGLRIGEGSVVIPISRLGLALAAFLSLLFLGESITLTKIFGIAMAIGAVILLSQ